MKVLWVFSCHLKIMVIIPLFVIEIKMSALTEDSSYPSKHHGVPEAYE